MNRFATAALVALLATGAGFGAWRAGAFGSQYANVVHATPVLVTEPNYVDVERVVPVTRGHWLRPVVFAYDVSYRVGDRLESQRLASDPGDQLRVGERRRVIGYDVAWRWRGRSGVVRMSDRPGKRLPVVDGAVLAPRPR